MTQEERASNLADMVEQRHNREVSEEVREKLERVCLVLIRLWDRVREAVARIWEKLRTIAQEQRRDTQEQQKKLARPSISHRIPMDTTMPSQVLSNKPLTPRIRGNL